MKASVGDRLVRASGAVDGPVRDGVVVGVPHADGTPPFLVRWGDTGEETMYYPGPDAHVESGGETGSATRPVARTWRVQVTLSHDGVQTTAQAEFVGDVPESFGAVGRARRDPGDEPVEVIGDEVAVARALRRLSDHLLGTAEEQITDSTGHPARVHI